MAFTGDASEKVAGILRQIVIVSGKTGAKRVWHLESVTRDPVENEIKFWSYVPSPQHPELDGWRVIVFNT